MSMISSTRCVTKLREQLLAELRPSAGVGGAATREEVVAAQLLVVEAALEDVRDAITSVDSDDLRQARLGGGGEGVR